MDNLEFSLLYPETEIEELKKHITTKERRSFAGIPKFVFLCGKKDESGEKSNRVSTVEFFASHKHIYPLFAEKLWPKYTINLLDFEHFLANLCDLLILFVESYGTAAELGSFSSFDEISQKMLVIIDQKYQGKDSFINNGPVRNILEKTSAENVLYVDLSEPFNDRQLKEYLLPWIDRRKSLIINKCPKKIEVSSFLIELLDIVGIVGPIHKDHLAPIYKKIKGFDNFNFTVPSLRFGYTLEFLVKTGLLDCNEHEYLSINNGFLDRSLFLFELPDTKREQIHAVFLKQKFKHIDSDIFLKSGDSQVC